VLIRLTERQFRIRLTLAPNESPQPDPVLYVHADETTNPAIAASRRATRAMRRLIAAVVNSGAPADELDAAAGTLERLADALEPHARRSRYEGTPGVQLGGDNTVILESHPMMGPSNPLATPMSLTRDADGVHATAVFGHQYEGPPGRLHGGFIAAAFDQVVGTAAALSGKVFFTGTLEVRYRRPTPLHVPLEFEGTLDRVEARRIHASARILVDGEVTAEAEGVMVAVPESTFHDGAPD
jgi:acyl-coenzyme A thioesterase PaaI-like protein